ncbi:MAG TPA: ATP-binding protein [Myxococcota bacterium]|nr:ATP-binding protein [Myxococcota bacterium]
MRYIKRVLEARLHSYLTAFPVVGITGPRQSGKSTLLAHCLPDYQFVTFDDFRAQEFLARDPEGFFNQYQNKAIFDEVQKVPDIFNHIKLRVDRDRLSYGKFVLTGSSQLMLMQNISESMAGRIGLLTLLPFQLAEMPKKSRGEAVFRGSYPELVLRNYQNSDDWCGAYLDTYVNKDVRSVSNIGDLRDFQRLIRLLAARASQQLEFSSLATELGVAVSTIKRWVSVLETSFIIFLLPPYFKNYGKRVVKAPKLYFYDVGLVSYLTGIKNQELYENGPMAGALFENFVVAEILKRELHAKTGAQLYYFRTSSGVEIDVIIDRGLSKEIIEIKQSATFATKMVQPMQTVMEPADTGYLLYNGDDFPYSNKIHIQNYQKYLLDKQ